MHHDGALQLYRISTRLKCLIVEPQFVCCPSTRHLPATSSYAANRDITWGLCLTGRPIGVRSICAGPCKALAEERKVVAGVLEWLMSGQFTSPG